MTTVSALNLRALDNSGYMQESEHKVGNRMICRYFLEDRDSELAVNNAVESIQKLFQDNATLIPLFSISSQKMLALAVKNRPNLIINGKAVCLTKKLKADGMATFCRDFFSESLVENPVKCEKGHIFEKKLAQLWIKKSGKSCPAGKHSHRIRSLEIDEELQEQIHSLSEGIAKQEKYNNHYSAGLAAYAAKNAALQVSQPIRHAEIAGGTIKIIVKIGGKVAKKYASANGLCPFFKASKKIPGFSLLAGLALATYRSLNGQPCRAAGEVTSGIVACYPGLGTYASIGIDLAIFTADIVETQYGELEINLSQDQLHELFGLDPDNSPSKEEINRAVRVMSLNAHPDTSRNFTNMSDEESTHVQATLNACKEKLYELYDY